MNIQEATYFWILLLSVVLLKLLSCCNFFKQDLVPQNCIKNFLVVIYIKMFSGNEQYRYLK